MTKMNAKILIALFAMIVVVASVAEAHKRFHSQPQFGEQHERCVCDCARPQPILPNKPYYGSAGYAQQPPHQHGGGYGNAGSYAVAGSYGSGGGQVSGGY